MTDTLFEPLDLGRYTLRNRITMAALTRSRAGRSGDPAALHTEYYSQRAEAGLIVTEGSFPEVTTRSFPGQAGIETPQQQRGWSQVSDAVHDRGGLIFMQIMHGGRVCQPGLIEGAQPEAPSAIASGTSTRDFDSRKECVVPRELTAEDLPRIVKQFRSAARRAVDAGVDGVEIHGANGYLLHQFLSPSSNQRSDSYGGSPENRGRLIIDVIQAVAKEIGPDRVGLRLSPQHNVQGVIEDDTADVLATYGNILDEISQLNLAYVSLLHAEPTGEVFSALARKARANGHTKVIGNAGFATPTQHADARALVELEYVDAVAVGRMFIANPDLPTRWRKDLPLNEPDPATFYTGGGHGYTDYPFAT